MIVIGIVILETRRVIESLGKLRSTFFNFDFQIINNSEKSCLAGPKWGRIHVRQHVPR